MIDRTVLVRPAQRTDSEGVWPLVRDLTTSFRPDKTAFHRSFDALLGAPGTLLVVAVDHTDAPGQSQVVGYLLASTHLTLFANRPVAWVGEIMVAEQLRRTGVGKRLMEAAENWADEAGAAYISLASRRAGDFYFALGYDESATFFKKNFFALP